MNLFSFSKSTVVTLAIMVLAVVVLWYVAVEYSVSLAALIAFAGAVLNEKWKLEQRKENTLNFFLETETSEFFQKQYRILEYDFLKKAKGAKKKKDTTLQDYRRYSASNNRKEQDIAQAVGTVLNFYEFHAYGVRRGLFEKEVAKESVRSMLCGLVYDLRFIIADARKENPKTYEHLVALYLEWADRTAEGVEWDDKIEAKLTAPVKKRTNKKAG